MGNVINMIGGGKSTGHYVWEKSNLEMTWTQSNVTSGAFKSVYYGNGLWVAAGNVLYYSTDGKTWVQSNVTSGAFNSVYYGNGIWVAGSGSNKGLYYSIDGKNWTQSNITSGYFKLIYYANGVWVTSGKGLYYSTDGKTWTQSNVTSGTFNSVYYSNGLWVAGSDSKGLYYLEPTLSMLGYVVGDSESDYPDKAVQDGSYYEKVLPPVNPSEII